MGNGVRAQVFCLVVLPACKTLSYYSSSLVLEVATNLLGIGFTIFLSLKHFLIKPRSSRWRTGC